MSNLIKSGFVAFSQNEKLVINANENKIIKAIDSVAEEVDFEHSATVEEALAEALIMDAELDGVDFGNDDLLAINQEQLEELAQAKEAMQQAADEIVKTAQAEAKEIVETAHNEAEQLRGQAYDSAEQIKAEAKEEGYRAGYEEAMEAASKEIAEQQMLLERQKIELEQIFQEKENCLLRETEHRMVELLCQLIPSITGVVVENQKDVLLYMINAAMHDLDNSKHFVIKVSQADYEELVERKAEIYGALNPAINMEIFEDAKLSSMQCLIETDNGIVDISLDVQLDNLITALKLMIVE